MEIYGKGGRSNIRVSDIERVLGLDSKAIQLALNFLQAEPYFQTEGEFSGQTGFVFIGAPTSAALRVAGAWPTPENLLERLIEAFRVAGEDPSRDANDRQMFKQSAEWMETNRPAVDVAVRAFGGDSIVLSQDKGG